MGDGNARHAARNRPQAYPRHTAYCPLPIACCPHHGMFHTCHSSKAPSTASVKRNNSHINASRR